MTAADEIRAALHRACAQRDRARIELTRHSNTPEPGDPYAAERFRRSERIDDLARAENDCDCLSPCCKPHRARVGPVRAEP